MDILNIYEYIVSPLIWELPLQKAVHARVISYINFCSKSFTVNLLRCSLCLLNIPETDNHCYFISLANSVEIAKPMALVDRVTTAIFPLNGTLLIYSSIICILEILIW